MKELQKKVLNAVAKIGLKTAEKACGNASFFGVHQPKEPEILKQAKK
ncbi:MAG: cyclic lactone autoinducer peptide [Clostridiales bacterium]|jgi:cyclic lactone autoinducer peptide|nr:cyclic lactone autoinducer peptide [Clostridiales bacterium]